MQTIAAQFGGEQLAYIAAFATGAALVFGDRPKADTFARLASLPSLRELDAAFGQQSALNYRCVKERPLFTITHLVLCGKGPPCILNNEVKCSIRSSVTLARSRINEDSFTI